jgi:hypothetical protein
MMNKCLRIGMIAAAIAFPSIVGATQLLPVDLEDMSGRASLVAVGRCTDLRSAWNAERTIIHTWATYELDRAIPDRRPREQIEVKVLGGTVGNITQTVVGGPVFVVGRRDLLFLTDSDEPGVFRLCGLTQGKVPIIANPATGESEVRLAPSSGFDRMPGLQAQSTSQERSYSLEIVLEAVRRFRRGI